MSTTFVTAERLMTPAESRERSTTETARAEAASDLREVSRAAADTEAAADGDALQAAEAEAQALAASSNQPSFGRPGRPWNRRSPFMIGMAGAFGVAITYALIQLLIMARDVLTLIGLALFLAIGLEPGVRLFGRWMSRRLAVTVVVILALLLVGGFLAAAIPPLVSQSSALVHHLPDSERQLQNRSSSLGRLNAEFHVQQRITSLVSGKTTGFFGGLLGAGQMVLSATASTATVIALTVYFLADLPRIRQFTYRLIPGSRRPRAILLGDEISTKVGAYVLGNVATSAIAGVGTFIWMLIFGIPYPLLLALTVALLDLIPVVGSTIGGIIVSLVALSVSLPIAIATAVFYIAFRLAEDYLIVPRILGRAVDVPATVTFVAVLIGGAVLGIIGALVAIPIAAAGRILLVESAFPRLDRA